MTSFPATMPATPAPAKIKMTLDDAVAVSESPFSFAQQVYEHQGQRFKADVTLPVMRPATAQPWLGFFASLRGRRGTFLMGDPDAKTPLGVATGTPLVNGGSQTGNSLITDGWTHGVTGILKTGDYFQLGSGSTARMYKMIADANSDGSGNATLTFWPNLRSSPADNAALVVTNCMTQFRLNAPFGWDANEVSTFSVVWSCTEALP